MIANSPEEYGFNNVEFHKPLSYETVTLKSPVDLEVAAECAETSVELIKELNPELRRWCTPPDVLEYSLRIPDGKKSAFLDRLSQIPEEDRFSVDRYTIRQGDTFKTISKKTGIPVEVILDLNNMEKIMPLKAGTQIYLPPKGKYALDREDKASVRKASYKQQKKSYGKNRKSAAGKSAKKVSSKQKNSAKSKFKKI
jgi:membrane-bound lytic murein transglycosylase D